MLVFLWLVNSESWLCFALRIETGTNVNFNDSPEVSESEVLFVAERITMQIVNHSNATPSELFGNNAYNNDPSNEFLFKRNNNANSNDVISMEEIGRRQGFLRARQVENIAKKLVIEFQAEQSYKYFIKVAYTLAESKIWEIADKALSPSVKCPVKYFVAVTHREMMDRS